MVDFLHLFHSLGCSAVTAAEGCDTFTELQFRLSAVKLTFIFPHMRDENPPVVVRREHRGGKVHKDPLGKRIRCL